jgi:hypothetical protein
MYERIEHRSDRKIHGDIRPILCPEDRMIPFNKPSFIERASRNFVFYICKLLKRGRVQYAYFYRCPSISFRTDVNVSYGKVVSRSIGAKADI